MEGIKFNFDKEDIDIIDGKFATANVDNQNVALITLSQICRLTYPEVGVQAASRMLNAKPATVDSILIEARKQAQKDGAKNVVIGFTEAGDLIFTGNYGN